jgi:integrase
MGKRSNGEGSLYQRESDGKWVGALVIDGRRRTVYGTTQKDAREKLRQAQRAAEDGLPLETGRGATLGAYLDQWCAVTLPARVRAGRLKPSTFDSYRDVVERHIVPTLGKEPLTKLTPAKVRAWLSAKQIEPSARQPKPRAGADPIPPVLLSSRTVQYFHAVLRKALADAVRDELVGRNVAALVEPPVVRREQVKPLTADEARAVLVAAANDRLRALWLVMLSVGLRRGEALALRWDDLDLEAGTVSIRRSLQRLRGDRDPATGRRRGHLVEVDPKTIGSSATVALPASLVTALTEHREVQRLERMVAVAWVDPGLVFTTSVGTALEPRNVNRAWSTLCAKASVRQLRLHDLRHSAASFMFAAGVDLKLVQTTLRHSRLATTADVYAHVLDEVQHQAADRMDGVLRSLSGR